MTFSKSAVYTMYKYPMAIIASVVTLEIHIPLSPRPFLLEPGAV